MKSAVENAILAMVGMFLAWAIPGAGHMLLGRWVRGAVIFVTIGALFWSGVLVGGVLTVHQHNARWWLAAQMLTGVHGLAGFHRQREAYHQLKADHKLDDLPTDPLELDALLQQEGIALNDNPGDNIARAYTGIAGMLNLLCITDVLLLGLMGVRGERGEERDAGVSPARPAGILPAQNAAGWQDVPHGPSVAGGTPASREGPP